MPFDAPKKRAHTTSIRPRATGDSAKPSIPVQDFDGRENRGAGDSGNTPDTRIDTPQIIKYER